MAHPAAASTLDTLYADHVNPQWVKLLEVLQMNARYERCAGVELYTRDGRRIRDFLSGYCVHNAGHNHPDIVEALHHELDRSGPAMLQSHVPELAGALAEKLCARAGGCLQKVFFASSGSEGVEAAIKFSRAHTRRCAAATARYSCSMRYRQACTALAASSPPTILILSLTWSSSQRPSAAVSFPAGRY